LLPLNVFLGAPGATLRAPCALTIGNFDGVHRGHAALLARVVGAARAHGLIAAVMTFEPHPREYFAGPGTAPARISNLRDKVVALAAAGIDRVFVRHFSQPLAGMPPARFIAQVLRQDCAARWLVVGDDFRFGARRAGDVALLRASAAAAGYEVERVPTVDDEGERISSSAVRAALAAGDLTRAEHLLGRPYAISGRVLHGARLGRTLGFPTLNLRIGHRLPAARGIFAVRVHGLAPAPWPGVASLGLRPTVDDSGRWVLETHLFDFAAQVYGKLIRVEFVKKLRDESKYASLRELQTAIAADALAARAVLAATRTPPWP
jgi:riboflavin kinase / FMN adenylyltransferase